MDKQQRVVICTVAIGGWYHRGVARMIDAFHEHSPGYEIQAWVNMLPPGTPHGLIEDGYDYTGYAGKAFALDYARKTEADIAILIDAAFYPIRSIYPLVQHVAKYGYYFCDNGNHVGEWSSDRCLQRMRVDREDAMGMREVSSYCVGLNFGKDHTCNELLDLWCIHSADRECIPGPHENRGCNTSNRNPGFVSADARVRGHRHDQSILSILAYRLGMNRLVSRPQFTAYRGHSTQETVLENHGLG